MEPIPSGSEDSLDLSRITLNDKYDSEWSIRIKVLLDPTRPNSQRGKLFLNMKDAKSATEDSLSPCTECDGIDCSLWGCDGYAHTLVTIDHGGLDLNETITLFVGEESILIEVPKAFLIQYSTFFRAAFNPASQFSEALTKGICLPEEDPRDILTLIRFLIEAPKDLYDLSSCHWPFSCDVDEEGNEDPSLCGSCHWRIDRKRPMFRFCAMVERLGFEFPEDRYWPILQASAGSPGQSTLPVAPPLVE